MLKQIIFYAQIAVVAAAVGAAGFMFWQLTDTQTKLKNTEESLTAVQRDLGTAIETNKNNVAAHKQALDQLEAAQGIAERELQAYKARDAQFRSIVDEIRSTPQAERAAVSPLVCRTVDRLYPSTTPACGN
jgi:uncharacterized protein HemX